MVLLLYTFVIIGYRLLIVTINSFSISSISSMLFIIMIIIIIVISSSSSSRIIIVIIIVIIIISNSSSSSSSSSIIVININESCAYVLLVDLEVPLLHHARSIYIYIYI